MRRDVAIVRVLEVHHGGIGRPARIAIVLVIHDRRLEVLLGGDLLHPRVTAVLELVASAIPVHDEGVNPQLLCLVDLFLQYHAVLRGVADVDVAGSSEPRLVSGNKHRLLVRRTLSPLGLQGLVQVGTRAAGTGNSAQQQGKDSD